ncbi:hypothetical protein [Streptomyces flaveus]|uniref:hypothetical protein n=1 Tax=Streptomyces flaveus TaxID=66370 RepID=UPI003333CF11
MTEWVVSEWTGHECHLRPVYAEATPAGAVAAVLRIEPFRVTTLVGDHLPQWLDVIDMFAKADPKLSRVVKSVAALPVLRWHARVELVRIRPNDNRLTATNKDVDLTCFEAKFDCIDTDSPDDPGRIEVRLWK